MRKLLSNKHGDMNMILLAVVMGIALAIGIIVVFNVHGGIAGDLSDLDSAVAAASGRSSTLDNSASNASNSTLSNIETYFTIAPLALIVIAAVGILSYVLLLRRT